MRKKLKESEKATRHHFTLPAGFYENEFKNTAKKKRLSLSKFVMFLYDFYIEKKND